MKNNWQRRKLGEILDLCDAGTWGEGSSEGIPLLRSTNMQNGHLVLEDLKYINVPKEKRDRYLLQEGDILMTKSSGSVKHIGKSLFIDEEISGKYGFSNFTQRLRVKKDLVLPKWVYLKISNPATRGFLLGASQTTTGLRNLKISALKNLEIPLPPLEEQKRIVERLERVLGEIQNAKRINEEALSDIDQILPAELSKIFEEGKKKGWEERELGEISQRIQYGYTASARKNGNARLLRITDIQNGLVNWGFVPFCDCRDIEKYKLLKNDIVFARTGATVGKSFLIRDVPENVIFASYLIRLQVDEKECISNFVYYFFQSSIYWDLIVEGSVGGAQPNVNGSKLKKIKIPLPSISEQKHIVDRLDAISEKAKKLRELHIQNAHSLTSLEQSVLSQAFQED